MKISVSNWTPVVPLYNNWFPEEWNPWRFNNSPNFLCLGPLFTKAVQSPKPPYIAHAFPVTVSTNWPIVIRLGKAWGFIIISGLIPSCVNGMSASGIILPTVPFCPQRLQNLSPILGMRSSLTLTFAILNPSSPSVINDLSTKPNCPFLGKTELSTKVPGLLTLEMTFPIRTFLSSSGVFSLIKP